jgi:hypothetical protein
VANQDVGEEPMKALLDGPCAAASARAVAALRLSVAVVERARATTGMKRLSMPRECDFGRVTA